MKNGRIRMDFIYRQAASIIRAKAFASGSKPDVSPTTIRTYVNDMMDYWRKGNFLVAEEYNQEHAIKRVKLFVKTL